MKNFILYTLLSSFAIGAFAIIDALFFVKMGLDWYAIALLSSVLNITVLIGELPTGILADKVGVFKSMFIGTLLRALACFCYIAEFPYHFYVASILAGLGIAFFVRVNQCQYHQIKIHFNAQHQHRKTVWGYSLL